MSYQLRGMAYTIAELRRVSNEESSSGRARGKAPTANVNYILFLPRDDLRHPRRLTIH